MLIYSGRYPLNAVAIVLKTGGLTRQSSVIQDLVSRWVRALSSWCRTPIFFEAIRFTSKLLRSIFQISNSKLGYSSFFKTTCSPLPNPVFYLLRRHHHMREPARIEGVGWA